VDWSSLPAVSSAIAAIAAASSTFISLRHVRTSKKSQQLSVLLPLYTWYRSEEARETRHRLYTATLGDLLHLAGEEKLAVDSLLGHLEFIAILVDAGLVDVTLVDQIFHDAPTMCLEAAGPYVHERRASQPHYALFLERLVERQGKLREKER
jgi:hypothetical protein